MLCFPGLSLLVMMLCLLQGLFPDSCHSHPILTTSPLPINTTPSQPRTLLSRPMTFLHLSANQAHRSRKPWQPARCNHDRQLGHTRHTRHKTCRTEAAPFPRPFPHFHLTTKMQTPVLPAVLPRRNAASHSASGWQRRVPVRPQIEVHQTSPSRMHSCCRHIANEAGQRCISTYLGLVCTIWYL